MSAIDNKYIYSELTHQIIGAAFEVQNNAGFGRPEKTLQLLMSKELFLRKLKFQEQVEVRLDYKGLKGTHRRFDFVVEEKIVVELKVGNRVQQRDFEQIKEYLKLSGLKLGLIILFSNKGVVVKRVPNLY